MAKDNKDPKFKKITFTVKRFDQKKTEKVSFEEKKKGQKDSSQFTVHRSQKKPEDKTKLSGSPKASKDQKIKKQELTTKDQRLKTNYGAESIQVLEGLQ